MTKSSKKPASAIIIGAGHNGLACAAYLARAGVRVTVLEAAAQIGGAAITREFAPGYRVSAGAHLLYGLDEEIRRDLSLERHGLRMSAEGLHTIALEAEGSYLSIDQGTLGGPGALNDDRPAMAEYHRQMGAFAKVIWDLRDQVPARLGTTNKNDLFTLGKLGLKIRRLGTDDMREFLRITGINVYDILEERFQSDLLKGALSLDGTLGTFLGTRSNNSMFCALHRYGKGAGYSLPAGGMGALTVALDAAARAVGAEIRVAAPVSEIRMDFDRACGVTLADGEQLDADVVISNADPKTTFEDLLGVRNVEAGFAHRIRNIRTRGCVAKLHLALKEAPQFTGLDATQRGQRLLIAPDLNYVEHAFNHAKYGEHSAEPVMEISVPTVFDDSLAPADKHVLSANVQWAPYDIKGGWDAARAGFEATCMEVLERYAPGIGKLVSASELLTPADLEQQFRMRGGHWHHGELSLDSFFMLRPVPGAAQYHTPVQGLYLCGAGSHPGGGIMGCAGRNAANVVLGKGA